MNGPTKFLSKPTASQFTVDGPHKPEVSQWKPLNSGKSDTTEDDYVLLHGDYRIGISPRERSPSAVSESEDYPQEHYAEIYLWEESTHDWPLPATPDQSITFKQTDLFPNYKLQRMYIPTRAIKVDDITRIAPEVAQDAKNKSIIPVQGDITSKDNLESIAARVENEVGFVNVVTANSGAKGPTIDTPPKDRVPSLSELHSFLWKTPMAEFEDAFVVNSTACFYTLLAFMPLLEAGNKSDKSPTMKTGVKSQFIATSSIGAFSRRPGMGFAYAASKAAAIHRVKQMATYLVPYHIRCNTICPGIYPSVMSQGMMGTADLTKEGSVSQELVPATRIGTEEDAAGATLFLCSRAGTYVNGNVLISDGGRLSIVPATY